MITSFIFSIFFGLYAALDVVSNAEFVLQKLSFNEDVAKFLGSSRGIQGMFWVSVVGLLISIMYHIKRFENFNNQIENTNTQLKDNPFATPEYDLTPKPKVIAKPEVIPAEKQETPQPDSLQQPLETGTIQALFQQETSKEEISESPVDWFRADTILELKEKSKLDLLCDNTDKYRKITLGEQGVTKPTQEIFIGVLNTSSETITNLRVEIEELNIKGKTYHNVPLRKMYDNPPYNQEFTLHPEEEMLFCLASHFPINERISISGAGSDYPVKIYLANETIPDELDFAEHIFSIVAKGSNTLPCRATLRMYTWKGGTLHFDQLKKPKDKTNPFTF